MKVCIVYTVFKETKKGITVEKTRNEVVLADSPDAAVSKTIQAYLDKGIVCKEVRAREPQEVIE